MARSPSDTAKRSDPLRSRLATAPLTPEGVLAEASNHTVLVRVGGAGGELRAVYKPRAGERPLWDFPSGTLHRRETAAYLVSDFLDWGLVPLTLLRDGPLGPGSVQLFIPHDPLRHYFALLEDPRHHRALALMAVFDLLVNNADRKASHVLLAQDGAIFGCDHGLTFHPQPKLRTVIWELGGAPLEQGWRKDLTGLARVLAEPEHGLAGDLAQLLAPGEIHVLRLRAEALADTEALPEVDERHRPYPWPLL